MTVAGTLPVVPDELRDHPVAAWREPLTIPSYLPDPPEVLPAFTDRRVYQGSSGRTYPLASIDRIATEPVEEQIDAIHIENRWVRVVILPGLGGRIHVALDKTTGYDFFYRNATVKPALVGLAGPWMAGGVEFNWPQHHRPATWLPCDSESIADDDGSVTVWCSDHDPMTRMKGMHGVRLRPDSSAIELRVRLYNRSDLTETFLWWANVAAKSGPDYQSYFPGDVALVADHARRAVVGFPHADRPYYGIDYPARADETFVSGGRTWTRDRLDFARDIDVPTSYMCVDSAGEFFGGYDHGVDAGFVHVADPAIAVGKKQWTWGTAGFGRAWDANLSDDGSSYVELMAGVFTDNQPDFSWLAPGETKVFSQFWYPISGIGAVAAATRQAALSFRRDKQNLHVGVVATEAYEGVLIQVETEEGSAETTVSLTPAAPVTHDFALAGEVTSIRVVAEADTLVAWEPVELGPLREPATEPPPPDEVESVDELVRIGTHLTQIRHATRSPEPYFAEALGRDPGLPSAATPLAIAHYRRGEDAAARDLLEQAIARQIRYNANPDDTSPAYHLGLVLIAQGDDDAAYRTLGRALWVRQWRAPAGWQMALIDARAGRWRAAEERLADVLRCEPEHLQARAALIWLRQRDDRTVEELVTAGKALDPLDWWLSDLAGDALTCDEQTVVDVALEYQRLGDLVAGHRLLQESRTAPKPDGAPRVGPMAVLLDPLAEEDPEPLAGTFPNRLAEYRALVRATEERPDDATAFALLGTWLYAHDRRDDAITAWRRAVALDPGDWISRRNLGLALMNHLGDADAAAKEYARALDLRPKHSRLRFEADRLAERRGVPVDDRLALLAPGGVPVDRDDAVIAYVNLLLTAGKLDEAIAVLGQRRFQPWEGGEGEAIRTWDRYHLLRVAELLADGDAPGAAEVAAAAFTVPESLGEQRHPLANTAALHLAAGDALAADGRAEAAADHWRQAAAQSGDFVDMASEPFSEQTASSLAALRRLGEDDQAASLAEQMADYLDAWTSEPATVDFFATSLPSMLQFADDPTEIRDRRATIMRAQLAALAGETGRAKELLAIVLAERPDHPVAADLERTLS